MRKFILPLIIGVALLLLALACFLIFKGANVYSAIPKSAIAVIESPDWIKLHEKLNSSAAGTALKKTYAINKLVTELDEIVKLSGNNSNVKSQLAHAGIVASVHLSSAEDIDFLFTVRTSEIELDALITALKSQKEVSAVNKHIFKKKELADVSLTDGRQITFVKLNGIVAFSFTSFLTENVITTLANGSGLKNDSYFKKLEKKFTRTGDFSIMVNYKEVNAAFPIAIKPEKAALLTDITASGNWAAYDVSLDNDGIALNGIGYGYGSKKSEKEITGENDLIGKIPDNVAYANLSFNDTSKINTNKENDLLANAFKNWVGKSKAFITLEPFKEDFTEQNLLMVDVTNKNAAYEGMKLLAPADGPAAAADSFMGVEILNIKSGQVLNRYFGGSLNIFTNTYFIVAQDVAFFANNPDVLKLVLQKIDRKELLAQGTLTGNNNGSLQQLIYVDPRRAGLIFKGLMKENSNLPGFLSELGPISYVSRSTGDGSQSIAAKIKITGGEQASSIGLLWKTRLKAPAQIEPQVIKLNSNGDKGIFIQDTLGNIYLLSSSGDILFVRNISGKVISNLAEVDYYQTGEMQYLFNTPNQVYMIDQSGNDVGGYPLRLSREATGGLLLIADGNSEKFKYFVPCSNGAIYGYDASGRPLPNWSPHNGTGVIHNPLLTYSDKTGDKIVSFNDDGKLMLMEMKGKTLWSVNNLAFSNPGVFVIRGNTGVKFLIPSGNKLTEISADGNDEIKPLIDTALNFTALVTSDTSGVYFFSNAAQIRGYNANHVFQNSTTLKDGRISALSIVGSTHDNYLKVYDRATNSFNYYTLTLNPLALAISADGYSTIADLFSKHEPIQIKSDAGGYVNCIRLK